MKSVWGIFLWLAGTMVASFVDASAFSCFSTSSEGHRSSFFRNSVKGKFRDCLCLTSPPCRESVLSGTTQLYMVFDFFKQRASEGVEQLSKLTDAASQGKLSEGLIDAALYAQQTNAAFAKGLAKSRTKLLYDLDALINNKGRDVLEDLETLLLQADLGLATTEDVLNEVKSLREDETTFFSKEDLRSILRGKLLEALTLTEARHDTNLLKSSAIRFANPDSSDPRQKLTVLFFMGANGMGKTTTIGKLANRLRTEGGQKVLLAACDTFRAGAVEQLELWAGRAEVDCFSPTETAKTPAAVLYGALDTALSNEYDTLVVDTSGRLSNNDALTAELVKMKRVIQKRLSIEEDGKANLDVPHETLLVIDAAQGRMALDSARQWNKEIGLSGLILTKLDGSARGGSVVAVSRELRLPVKLVGVGESIDDLRDFNPETFVDGLLGIGSAGGGKNSGSGSKTEANELADRLKQLRKARDERAARQRPAETSRSGDSGMGTNLPSSSGSMEFAPIATTPSEDIVPSGGGRRKPPRKGKSRRKKKGRR